MFHFATTVNKKFKKPSKKSVNSGLYPGILAFRTITTLLSLIQCPSESTKVEPLHISKLERKELRVLDSLAALLIREHEKAAVMAKPFDGKSIQVTSVVNLNNPRPAVTANGFKAIRWLASLNSRFSPPLFPEDEADAMQVVDPNDRVDQKLLEHKDDPDKLLNRFLLTQWGIESFATHVWMLTSLLRQSKDHLITLQLYVVAADYKKMLSRMNHTVSTHYLTCLQRVKSRTYQPIEERPYDENDQLFLDDIPILAQTATTKIPNLEKIAQAAEKKEPFNLYNKDTCVEFHELLCELLERFHQSLNGLKVLQKSKVTKRKDPAQLDEFDEKEIRDEVLRVTAIGRTLRGIVRGNAIKAHLATIAPFLEVKTGKFWPMVDVSESSSEDNSEFHLLKPYSTDGHNIPLLPWKSFHDWLRLMVHHFDAIHVLDNHLMELHCSPIDISFKILYPSFPDDLMLPWKEVLENEKYFPAIPHTPDQPTVDELVAFLTSPTLDEDDNSVKDIIGDVAAVKNKIKAEAVYMDSAFATDIRALTVGMNDLKDYSSTGWKDYVVDILGQVEALRRDSTTDDRLSRLESISNMLEILNANFSLYKKMKPGDPLSNKNGFDGVGHCEVFAALSNSLSGTPGPHTGFSEHVLNEYGATGQTIGLSKRCCPVCTRVLSLLKPNGSRDRFLVSGGHSMISPCTLPEGLPEPIIDQMVLEFGLRLRKEFVNLQKTAEVHRARAQSNDTRRISMDSIVLTERERANPNLFEAMKKTVQ